MKKTIFLSLVVLNLVCAVSFGAFSSGVSVKVPFAFVAGGKTLPAGQYVMERVSMGGQGVLVIRGAEDTVILTALSTSKGVGKSTPRIEFIKTGNNYVLSVVKTRETASHVARAHETAKKLQIAAN